MPTEADGSLQRRGLVAVVLGDWPFVLLAGVLVSLAVAGMVRTFTPVPYWDSWSGGLGFYLATLAGDWPAWFRFHNEHRMFLGRVPIWVDWAYFGGLGLVPLLTNLLLPAAAAVAFSRLLPRDRSGGMTDDDRRAILALIVGLMFWWAQHENFTWAFQPAFFLAQLVPLLALLALGWAQLRGSTALFALACALGVASAGTMANGVLILPCMFLAGLALGLSSWRQLLLALLAALVMGLYFVGYVTPEQHRPVWEAPAANPLGYLTYILAYLGGPIAFVGAAPLNMIFGGDKAGTWIAAAAGVAFLGLAAWALLRAARQRFADPIATVLFGYIIFIAGSGAVTGAGRLFLGIHQVISSRYTTPALMAWAALLIIILRPWLQGRREGRTFVRTMMLASLIVLLIGQVKALRPMHEDRFNRQLAGLAMALDAQDAEQLKRIYPLPDRIEAIVEEGRRKRLGFFALEPYAQAASELGKPAAGLLVTNCPPGRLSTQVLPSDSRLFRIQGQLPASAGLAADTFAQLADANGTLVGWILVSAEQRQPDTLDVAGYAVKSATDGDLTLRAQDGRACVRATLQAPGA